MAKFRNNETKILLATNIIARGIDVRNACFVMNVGPPKVS
jgi:superfamily II DNA/RNA helicase